MGDIVATLAIIFGCLVIGSALMVVAFACCKISNRKHKTNDED